MAKSVDAQDLKSCGNLSRAGSSPARGTTKSYYAGVAQLVERQPSKLNVASSTLVSRSILFLKTNDCINSMVTVVQLVERQFVALVVAGSSPVGHPINMSH